jgi:hypothetical protein
MDSLFTKQLRDSGLLADVLVGMLKKDISFALRRGTIAQVTTALDAAQRAVEDQLILVSALGGVEPRRSVMGCPLWRSCPWPCAHLGRCDLVRALERGPLVVVRHAISYHFLATVRAP